MRSEPLPWDWPDYGEAHCGVGEPGDARQRIAATVTGEVLVRLIGDLNAVLDEFVAA